MKSVKNNLVKLLTVTVLFTLLFSTASFSQTNSIKDLTDHKYALENLTTGINSDNAGVRKSAVYFAGKYKIEELVSVLADRLDNENDPSVRLLIAYSLYEINDAEGMKAVKELSLSDVDAKVKRMSKNLYDEYLLNHSTTAAL